MCNLIRFHRLSRFLLAATFALVLVLLGARAAVAQGNFGTGDDILVQGDFDGDGNLDYAVWRPSTGFWFVIQSSNGQLITQQWGLLDDVPVPGDYDGDGLTDFAVWRPADGTWHVIPSSNPTVPLEGQLGLPGDIPVPNDYSNSGATQFAVWRPSDGTWYIEPAGGSAFSTLQWGLQGDIPVPGSYFTPNGPIDFAVWRPSDGTWYVLSNDQTTPLTIPFGLSGDVPVPGDYDGDGLIDAAVWAPSEGNLYIQPSTNPSTQNVQQVNSSTSALATRFNVGGLGAGVYIHVSGDFDGDHLPDYALWRPSDGTWFVVPSSNPAAPFTRQFGLPGDVPIPGTFVTANGPTDFAVWRPSNGTWFVQPNNGLPSISVGWGLTGDIPVLGDFDGDGLADFAVWRPTNGDWYIQPNNLSTPATSQNWGVPGDVPVPGDYDGDGKTDLAIWRPSEGSWYVLPSNTSAAAFIQPSFLQPAVVPGDVPIAGDYDNDGATDFALFSSSEANLYVLPNVSGANYYSQQFGAVGSISIYNQPPLTPFIGAAVRQTSAHRNARPNSGSTRTGAVKQRTLIERNSPLTLHR
ncbi:MAG: FG-GAP repeat domain-containing protein [Bryobacteraceae bacterium]